MPHPRTLQTLPIDYEEALYLSLTAGRRLLWLNLAAIGLLLVALVVFVGWLLLYHTLGAPLTIASLPDGMSRGVGLLMLVAVLPLHELLHGLAMSYYGHRPRYGVKPLKGVLYATADGAYFWRDQFYVIALAPLVVISLLAFVSSLFFPAGSALWLMFAAMLNASGAVGDLWMVYQARRFPPAALVQDLEDGMRIYIPTVDESSRQVIN